MKNSKRPIPPLQKRDRKDCKIIVVMPAYNTEKTLLETYMHIPENSYDEIIVVDDASYDKTIETAKMIRREKPKQAWKKQ